MLGTLRLVLAMVVGAYHLGWMPGGFAVGVAAVAGFYAISGYVMTGYIRSNFAADRPNNVAAFYRDRILRLAPQYYFWTLLSVAGMALGWHYSYFQDGRLGITSGLAALLVIPLGAWMYVSDIGHYMPIPQAWSLSSELLFCGLFPFVLRYRILLWVCLGVSCATFCAATANAIDPDFFAYRLLPGSLLYFLLGYAVFAEDRAILYIILGVFIIDASFLAATGQLLMGHNPALFFGGLAAAPVLAVAARVRSSRIDREFGAASYGCYLSHWLFLPLLTPYANSWWAYLAMCSLAAVVGWISFKLVEQPFSPARHRLRMAR